MSAGERETVLLPEQPILPVIVSQEQLIPGAENAGQEERILELGDALLEQWLLLADHALLGAVLSKREHREVWLNK